MKRAELERLASVVVDALFTVHCELGPGLLESAYEMALCRELSLRGVSFERQKSLPINNRGASPDCGYRIDVLVADSIILELKAVESLLPIHQAQLFTYLKLTRCHLGFLVKFNVRLIKSGIKRVVRNIPDETPAPSFASCLAASRFI